MGEVVNLRLARKEREKRAREEAAQAKRLAYGRTKSERESTQASRLLERRKLDAHRRSNDDAQQVDEIARSAGQTLQSAARPHSDR